MGCVPIYFHLFSISFGGKIAVSCSKLTGLFPQPNKKSATRAKKTEITAILVFTSFYLLCKIFLNFTFQ